MFARGSAGLADSTIQADIQTLEAIRSWLERPIREMTLEDGDRYFGQVLRGTAQSTRLGKTATLRWFFRFLELRYKAEIFKLTGCVIECPIDEVNSPRGLGTTLDRLRIDRFVEELLVHGPDARQFMAVFDVTATTAMRYAEAVGAMLGTAIEDDAPAPSTHGQTREL